VLAWTLRAASGVWLLERVPGMEVALAALAAVQHDRGGQRCSLRSRRCGCSAHWCSSRRIALNGARRPARTTRNSVDNKDGAKPLATA
jgi:hypothetical protein